MTTIVLKTPWYILALVSQTFSRWKNYQANIIGYWVNLKTIFMSLSMNLLTIDLFNYTFMIVMVFVKYLSLKHYMI